MIYIKLHILTVNDLMRLDIRIYTCEAITIIKIMNVPIIIIEDINNVKFW